MNSSQRVSPLVWSYIVVLMLLIAGTFLLGHPSPTDDHFLYQKFIETLAAGKLDLSIPGFHGTDIFGFIVYLFTRSPISQIYGLMIPAVLLPLPAFLAARAMFRDTWSGVFFATIVAMMPFVLFVCLRGWTGPGYWFWMLLAIWASARRSAWAGVPWALAVLSKPFAIVLLPLMLALFADETDVKLLSRLDPRHWWKKSQSRAHKAERIAVLSGLAIIVAYVVIEYVQAGHLIIGAHEDLTPGSAFQGPVRILLNLAHALQILFSVHNYYFPVPALTGPGNMLHTTPVLVFLGLFGLLSPRSYWENIWVPRALLLGSILGIVMNALLDHMDHYYMEASVLLLILAAIPLLKKHGAWIPIVLATLHFQWFYFYLQFRVGFGFAWTFFALPLVVDICFAALWIGVLIGRRRDVR